MPKHPADAPPFAHATGTDPLEALLASPPAESHASSADIRREASELLLGARRDGAYRAALPRAIELVGLAPAIEPPQRVVAYLLDGLGDMAAALACWRGISARFPASAEAFGYYVRLAIRQFGAGVGGAIFADRFPSPTALIDPSELMMAAVALEELKRPAEAIALLARVVRARPDITAAWLRLADLREATEGPAAAAQTLAEAAQTCSDPRIAAQAARVQAILATLNRLVPEADRADAPAWRIAMNHLFDRIAQNRSELRGRSRAAPGGIVLIGGSLGGGGAERQLVATAIGLQGAIRSGTAVAGVRPEGPVTVVCRRLGHRHGHDFFLPALAEAGVATIDYMALAPLGGRPAASVLRDCAELLEFLPVRMREGALHLADPLRALAPDVAQIWQDGMIFATGLAALLAGVPRIVLNVRTLPPTDRADRWRPEQQPLYRALLAMPGVVLTANSLAAAARYEEWLGLPAGAIAIVPNGVAPLDPHGSAEAIARWEGFDLATGGGFTLGGVMRFDHNKRPLDWLEIAERLLALRPDARFVLVGDGELRSTAEQLAARRGFGERVLFVGRSAHVGYWLGRMDALLLTSRHEGLPNVLIEAQRAGAPVVTTPAGGAAETLIPGITGHVLASAETIDTAEAAALLARLACASPGEREAIRKKARDWAERRFSIPAMLERTVEIFASPIDTPLLMR